MKHEEGPRAGRRRLWRTGPRATGAALLLGLTVGALWVWRGAEQIIPGAGPAMWRVLAGDLLVAVALAAVVLAVVTGIAFLRRRPWPAPFLAVLAASAVLLLTMGAGPVTGSWRVVSAVVLVCAPVLGAWVGDRFTAGGSRKRLNVAGALALGAVAVVAVGLVHPGLGAPHLAPATPDQGGIPVDQGTHEVRTVTYGSGAHQDAGPATPQRYVDPDVHTRPVDASDVLDGWQPGSTRSQVWGFDAGDLPLNATVWAPRTGDDHPLVLVAHGNGAHADSELGFDYLGELLASHGYVVVAVDQGFLNTSLLDRSGGLTGADRTRAWLLLQHLEQWISWAEGGDGPAAIDPERVTLLGHSRGGEAAAVAAALAATDPDPDLPGSELAGAATIGAVVALAPSDGNDLVHGAPVHLHGVDYLTIAGSHDADVGSFAGADQYARVHPGPEGRKAALAVYRANHSQFNTRWGRFDAGFGAERYLTDTAALLPAETQQRLTGATVAAFLDQSMMDRPEAWEQISTGAATVLAGTERRLAHASGESDRVHGFDQTAPPGVTVEGAGTRVVPLPQRRGPSENRVLHLTPDGSTAALTVTTGPLTADDRIVIDVAAPTDDPGQVDGHGTFAVVVLTDAAGSTVTCPLTDEVPTQLPGRTAKLDLTGRSSQPHLHTMSLPVSCFGPEVDPAAAQAVQIRFHEVPEEGLYVDNVGVSGG